MTHSRKIGDIDLSHPLSGREGVDPNHASRIRIQTLLDQHKSLIQQTQFADAKSAGLITVVGLLALNGPVSWADMTRSDLLSVVGGIIAMFCMLFCVFTIFPRYPRGGLRKTLPETDRFSWPSLTTQDFDAEAYSNYMHTAEVSQIVHSIAHSNSAVSKILLRKFQTLRIAFSFGALFILIIFARHASIA